MAEGRVGVAEGSPVGRGRGKKKRNKKGKRWCVVMSIVVSLITLYFRGTPIEDPPSAQERQRFSERAQRFGKQGAAEGNKNIKKKISMDELLKRTLVSLHTHTHTHTLYDAILSFRPPGEMII